MPESLSPAAQQALERLRPATRAPETTRGPLAPFSPARREAVALNDKGMTAIEEARKKLQTAPPTDAGKPEESALFRNTPPIAVEQAPPPPIPPVPPPDFPAERIEELQKFHDEAVEVLEGAPTVIQELGGNIGEASGKIKKKWENN